MAYGGSSLLKMSEDKMSDQTFNFVCTSCAKKGKKLEAVKYCVECSAYCCQSCTDAHTMFPALENHNLMEVNQGNQASSSPIEFPTERCSKHAGKVLDMYCEGHDAIGCYVCIAKDHKSCQDSIVHSIPDMIDTLFKMSDCKQTHGLLKDMMVSMTTVSQSKDTKLQILIKSKKEALDKVNTFEKALQAVLRKKAESSRQEVEKVYKKLKTELLDEKQTVDSIHGNMKTTDDKLDESDGNRAQHFVCSKIAQEQIQEAERVKTKQIRSLADDQITFIPDQLLMEHMKALQGIGQVLSPREKKNDVYKAKTSTEIPIKLPDDSKTCNSVGCCLTPDDQLLVTDYTNKKLKRIDIQKMTVIDYCTFDSNPIGVCCISKQESAVACENKIQFVSLQNQMSLLRQIKPSHKCYGIAFNDGKLYVTDDSVSLYIYDMSGTLLKTISQDKKGNHLFSKNTHITFNDNTTRIIVGDHVKGHVYFDIAGNYESTVSDKDIKGVVGVCADGNGNVLVVGMTSGNVVQFSEKGRKVGVVVKECSPLSVCFHPGLNKLFVTTQINDVVNMYELE